MAETSGTALNDVTGMLETSERLRSLPETTEALRRGELSGPQVSVWECPPERPGAERRRGTLSSRICE